MMDSGLGREKQQCKRGGHGEHIVLRGGKEEKKSLGFESGVQRDIRVSFVEEGGDYSI